MDNALQRARLLFNMLTADLTTVITSDYNWTTGGSREVSPSLLHAVVVGTILAFIDLGAVVGNALVILSVLTNPKLRTITNRFVASLACADLSVGVLVMPLAVKVSAGQLTKNKLN